MKAGNELGENEILFPQLELTVEKEKIEKTEEPDNLITIDDFKKIDLRTAVILECEKVEKSKKLLKLKIKSGNKEKQIVAGIAEHYSPEELKGKTIIIVDNLKPSKLMGIESQGMLLAAKKDGKLTIVTTEKSIDDGADVS